MPDDVVGGARIRIEPDLTGFDAALEAGVQQAADQAAEAIIAAFRSAAETSASELSQIGQLGLVDVTTTADTAATDIEAAFAAAASEADASLATIGQGAGDDIAGQFAGIGDQISDEFIGTGAAIAGDIEAGAADAQASLEGLGSGTGDALAGEFAGVGEAISSNVSGGVGEASAALSALEGAGQGVVENLAQGFEGLGGVIAAAVTGVAIAGAFSSAERVQSIAGVTNKLIETTGGVAHISAEEILFLGDSLEDLAGIESELVQEGANVLLTFKNVRNEIGAGNDIFDRAIIAGADLSAVLGGDISGSALQLGKALQDPIRGLSLLGRAGVTFTADQKALVRSLVEEGDLLAAQKVILGEVEGQVGGAAEAAAKASDRIRASLGNLGEEFGAGLLPAADEFADRLPEIVEDIGPEIRELGEALGEGLSVAVDGLLALAPLLGVTTDLLVLMLPALETAVDLVDAIPDPVLQAAAAIFTMNKALVLVRGTSLLAASGLGRLAVPTGAVAGAFNVGAKATPGFVGGLRAATKGLSGATLAAGVGLTALSMYSDMMASARAEGEAFGQSLRDSFDPSTASIEELQAATGDLDTKIAELKGSVDDSFLGRNTVNKDFNESIEAGIESAEAFRAEIVAAEIELKRLNAESEFGGNADRFVGISDAIAAVRDESDSAADAIANFRVNGDNADASFIGLASTLGEAALSEDAMAEAAQALGVDIDALRGFIENVNTALDTFIDTAVSGLPQIADAFRDTNDDAKVSAREFITGLQEDTFELAAFFADLKVITEAGFAEVAGALAEQGSEIAGVAARQMADAARDGNTALILETQAGLDERDQAIADSTNFLRTTLGPDYISATGLVGAQATMAFGENFDPQEQVRIAGALAASGLDEEGQRIAATAATMGETAAQEFGEGLGLEQEAIDAAIAAGVAIRENAPTDAARAAGDDLGAKFAEGMIAGMARLELEVAFAAQGLVGQALISARKLAGIRSPSELFARELGMPIGQGIAVGIAQTEMLVLAATKDVLKGATSALDGLELEPLRTSLSREVTAGRELVTAGAAIGAPSSGGLGRGDEGNIYDLRGAQFISPDPVETGRQVVDRLRAASFLGGRPRRPGDRDARTL